MCKFAQGSLTFAVLLLVMPGASTHQGKPGLERSNDWRARRARGSASVSELGRPPALFRTLERHQARIGGVQGLICPNEVPRRFPLVCFGDCAQEPFLVVQGQQCATRQTSSVLRSRGGFCHTGPNRACGCNMMYMALNTGLGRPRHRHGAIIGHIAWVYRPQPL